MSRLNLLLLLALIVSSLYLVQVAHQSRSLFVALERAQRESRELGVEFKRLDAERQAQSTHLRVEKMARDKLAMRNATPGVTQYVDDPLRTAAAGGAR